MMSENKSKILEVEEKLNDITECSICAETFKEPKILSCIHTFCKNCLQELATKLENSSENGVPCPICRKKFFIPYQGIDGLQKNFFMENLIEMRKILSSSSNPNVCEACLEEDPSTKEEAEVYCTDCKQKLCKECYKYHYKNKLLKNHKLIHLNEFEESEDTNVKKVLPRFCDKHELQLMNIFCWDCSDTMCPICFIEDHKSHKGSTVDSVVDDFRIQIQENVDDLKKFIPDLRQKEKKLEDDKTDFIENLKKLEIEIIKSRDELKSLVDAHSDSLLSYLNIHHETSLKNMEICKDDLETLLISLDSFQEYCNQILTNGSASSICQAIKSLNNRATELRTIIDLHSQDIFQFHPLQLSKTSFSAKGNIIGEFKGLKKEDHEKEDVETTSTESTAFDAEDKQPEECYNVRRSESQISDAEVLEQNQEKIRDLEEQIRGIALGQNTLIKKPGSIDYNKITKIQSDADMFSEDPQYSSWQVKGLDILGNELFILVVFRDIRFQVYDLVNFRFKRRWKNDRLIEVKHIKSCKYNECLYLMNIRATVQQTNNEIVSFDRNGSMVRSWAVEDAVGLLSITNEANILFTAKNKNQLQEYSSEGQLLRVIQLSWNLGFDDLWHSIKLNSSHYVVCHGQRGHSFQRICIIDNEGSILQSTGKDLNFGPLVYMEKDGNNNLIVISNHVRRLIVFNSNLEVKNQLFQSSGYLLSICVDESNRRLFVVETDENFSRYRASALIFDTESPPS